MTVSPDRASQRPSRNPPSPKLVLASASPARRKLLNEAGMDPAVCPSDFDESQVAIFDPGELVQVLAQQKAQTVADRLAGDPVLRHQLLGPTDASRLLVLGCDSVLMVNGSVYGKPDSPADAIARWQRMRGKTGELYTGHVLVDRGQQRVLPRVQVTRVQFANPSDRQIEAYVATGEPLNCAGCFALEGRGGLFVERIDGCHTNVIGLSLPLFRAMLAELGYDVTDFWA